MSHRHITHWLTAALLVFTTIIPAMALIPVPALQGRVTDTAGILSPATREHISTLLKSHEDRTTNQVAVLTVPSLEGESIEEFATRVFDSWRLGRKKKDNGVLVVIASGDRRMRIEVGYGLEGKLTDLLAGRILDQEVRPKFKEGKFDVGIMSGVSGIMKAVKGEYAGTQDQAGNSEVSSFWTGPAIAAFAFGGIALFILIMVLLAKKFPAAFSGGGGGSSDSGSSSSGSSSSSDSSSSDSSSSSGSSGSDSYSGGGGSYGGGGASSDW